MDEAIRFLKGIKWWSDDPDKIESWTDQYQMAEMMDKYAEQEIKKVVEQIYSQCQDGALTKDWIGFKAYIDDF